MSLKEKNKKGGAAQLKAIINEIDWNNQITDSDPF